MEIVDLLKSESGEKSPLMLFRLSFEPFSIIPTLLSLEIHFHFLLWEVVVEVPSHLGPTFRESKIDKLMGQGAASHWRTRVTLLPIQHFALRPVTSSASNVRSRSQLNANLSPVFAPSNACCTQPPVRVVR